jgi:ferredoxin-NADP reductase
MVSLSWLAMLRAYSIASANHEDLLRFLSIKVPNGPLTSRLQHINAGDQILISRKPTGTLVLHDPKPKQAPLPAEHWNGCRPLHERHQGP